MTTNQQTNSINNICIFCGSGAGQNPAFAQTATDLGHFLAANKIRLVYGGGDIGLMGILARSTQNNGGAVTGIIPEFLLETQRGNFTPDNEIITKDMHTRKAEMYKRADAFIALPGGIGTLEELVETMTWSQLGTHQKPIFLFNIENFWAPFLTLLDDMRHQGFIRKSLDVDFKVINTIEQLKRSIELFNNSPEEQDEAQNLSRL